MTGGWSYSDSRYPGKGYPGFVLAEVFGSSGRPSRGVPIELEGRSLALVIVGIQFSIGDMRFLIVEL